MTATAYLRGTSAINRASFYTSAGPLGDPTTVVFKLRSPSGVQTNETFGGVGSITKFGVGVYERIVLYNESGVWKRRWESTGNPSSVIESEVLVLPSDFT